MERVPVHRIAAVTWQLDARAADTPYVDAWKSRLGLHVESVSADEASSLLGSSLILGDAPTALMTGAFERAAMRRVRALGADVLLTGVGGDETLSGSTQAAVRARASFAKSLERAVLAELPWDSTATQRVSEMVLRPALRPLAPRWLRERKFVARTKADLPRLGPVTLQRLHEAAALHIAAARPVPRTAMERLHEVTRRPFWAEMGELRAQLEAAEGIARFDIPLDAAVQRVVASIAPDLLLDESRHRGLLRRVLQARAPQVVTSRFDKADFDAFGQRMLQEARILPRLRSLAECTELVRLGLVEQGAITDRWQSNEYPADLTTFLGWWPFLTAEAFAREHA